MEDILPEGSGNNEAGNGRGAHRRATQRDSLFLQATLHRIDDETPLTMRIRNLSAGGMMAEIGEPFRVGDRIAIELRGIGALAGTVVWRVENRIGIAFDQEIDPRRARKSVPARAPQPACVARRSSSGWSASSWRARTSRA